MVSIARFHIVYTFLVSNILPPQIKGYIIKFFGSSFLGWVRFLHPFLAGSNFYSFQQFSWPPVHSVLHCSVSLDCWSPHLHTLKMHLYFLQCSEHNYKSFESRIKNEQFHHIKTNFWKPLHTEIQSQREDKLKTLQEQPAQKYFLSRPMEKFVMCSNSKCWPHLPIVF